MIHQKQVNFTDTIQIKNITEFALYRKTATGITLCGGTATGFPTCGIIFNREAFIASGGFDDKYPSSGDAFLCLPMMELGYEIYQSSSIVGYYRIGDNLSLNYAICSGFIKDDVCFREYWYNKNSLRKLFYKLYGNYLYSSDIDTKCSLFGQYNKDINIDNLDFQKKYRHYGKFNLIRRSFSLNLILYRIITKMRNVKI